MSEQQPKLSDQVRDAVTESGLSRYRIAKELGISESSMSRFMAGSCGLSMANLDKLAELLGFRLTTIKPKASKRKRPREGK